MNKKQILKRLLNVKYSQFNNQINAQFTSAENIKQMKKISRKDLTFILCRVNKVVDMYEDVYLLYKDDILNRVAHYLSWSDLDFYVVWEDDKKTASLVVAPNDTYNNY